MVKAVLSAEKDNRTPIKYFEETYRTRTGEAFPWEDLNYASVSECLEIMSDVCAIEKLTETLRTGSNSEELFVVLKDESAVVGDSGKSDNLGSDSPAAGADNEFLCQDVRNQTTRKISEGSQASGQSDLSRPSTPSKIYYVLSFPLDENPSLTA